jgi:NADPH:quinone reductase
VVNAAIIKKFGGPEVFEIINIDLPKLKEGEVRIANKAIGLNYIDINYRNGRYKINPPSVLGFEASGVIEDVKGDVGSFKVGDRVAYATGGLGAYCQKRNIHNKFLVKIPDQISFEQAAAVLFKGMTAHFLLRRTCYIQEKMTILVHAAAGGVGTLLCQLAKHIGVKVIGTVGSKEKEKYAHSNGCKHVINYQEDDFVKRTMGITKNLGVNAVFDSVGKDTIHGSIKSLMPLGLLVSYGSSSGKIPPLSVRELSTNSIFFTSPSLFFYKQNKFDMTMTAVEIFALLEKGIIKDNIRARYKFEDIALAHADIENRRTMGSSIIQL